jgi:hypothetical protein
VTGGVISNRGDFSKATGFDEGDSLFGMRSISRCGLARRDCFRRAGFGFIGILEHVCETRFTVPKIMFFVTPWEQAARKN